MFKVRRLGSIPRRHMRLRGDIRMVSCRRPMNILRNLRVQKRREAPVVNVTRRQACSSANRRPSGARNVPRPVPLKKEIKEKMRSYLSDKMVLQMKAEIDRFIFVKRSIWDEVCLVLPKMTSLLINVFRNVEDLQLWSRLRNEISPPTPGSVSRILQKKILLHLNIKLKISQLRLELCLWGNERQQMFFHCFTHMPILMTFVDRVLFINWAIQKVGKIVNENQQKLEKLTKENVALRRQLRLARLKAQLRY